MNNNKDISFSRGRTSEGFEGGIDISVDLEKLRMKLSLKEISIICRALFVILFNA